VFAVSNVAEGLGDPQVRITTWLASRITFMTIEHDPYLWLENVDSERSLSWVRAQNAVSQSELEARPEFKPIRDRLLDILNSDARIPNISQIGAHVYNFWQDAQHPRGLWRRTSLESYRTSNPNWETVLDLDALSSAESENWVWKGAQVCKPDNRRALIALSRGGADATVLREFDLQSGSFVQDGFHLPEAKNWVFWRNPDQLFVGTDFGPGSQTTSGYPRIVKLWSRGTPLRDAETIFEGQTDDVWVYAYADQTPGFERDVIVRGISFFSSEVRVPVDGQLVKLQKPDDAQVSFFREHVLLDLKNDWTLNDKTYPQGALIATRLENFMRGEQHFDVLFEPSERRSLHDFAATKNNIVLNVLDNVKHKLEALEYRDGLWQRRVLNTPEFGTVGVQPLDPFESDAYLLNTTDFTTPSSLSLADVSKDQPELLKQLPAMFDASSLHVQQLEATSRDGTRVPYFVVSGKNLETNGTNPTLLYAYGGFEVPMLPTYSGGLGSAWLEPGGVYVLANIRGGGEFGPAWHRSALRENRQRAFDDFIAVAEDLIARGITSARHLGIQGGSNGGLLMGVMLTQRPDLFRAVVCQVPLLDMRRYHLLLAGASWMEEYGDPDTDDWAFISRFSPYQNLKPRLERGLEYPRVLFTTSTRDDRVHPGHARKMFARMQEYGHDALYFENIEGGHGGAANNAQIAYMNALSYTFLWNELR
jgi:prolyl oligopeptidase